MSESSGVQVWKRLWVGAKLTEDGTVAQAGWWRSRGYYVQPEEGNAVTSARLVTCRVLSTVRDSAVAYITAVFQRVPVGASAVHPYTGRRR